jgi:hypothetical protein
MTKALAFGLFYFSIRFLGLTGLDKWPGNKRAYALSLASFLIGLAFACLSGFIFSL